MILSTSPLMGSAEIGAVFGVGRQRVQQLIAKPDFPRPYTELAMGKIWLAKDVRAWGVATNRLAPDAGLGEPPAHPAPGPRPAEPAPKPPRRSQGHTEEDADAFISGLSTDAYAALCRQAKAACGSLDYEVYHPVMRRIVLDAWQAADNR